MTKRRQYMKILLAVLTAAVFCLSGCSVDELAQNVAARIKEKTDAMFEGGKSAWVCQKAQEYFVTEEPEEIPPKQPEAAGEIEWHDKALSEAIAYLLQTAPEDMTYAQLSLVTDLDLSETENTYGSVQSFEDLAYFTGLESLTIYGDYLDIETTDFSAIGELTSLKVLTIDGCVIEDPSFAARLTELTELYFIECELTDISFVENLEKLENVSFYGNYLLDITPLADHNQLRVLSIAHNQFLQDISPLAKLPALDEVGMHYCAIGDISPLTELENLKMLNLSGNPLSDLSALNEMPQLEVLGLDGCGLTDISALSNLTEMKRLYLEQNHLTDISALAGMTKLNELRLSGNQITDFTPLQNTNGLFRLDIYNNPIKEVPENVMKVPYFDVAYYYSWNGLKPDETAEEERALATLLMSEYCPNETGTVTDMTTGYLNEDEYMDAVVMVEREEVYVRAFYVFLGGKDGNYTSAGEVSTFEAYQEIITEDSYCGMIILNHNLMISHHAQDIYGWFDNSFYQYDSGEMVLAGMTSVNYCVYYSGADYCEYDFLKNTSSYSVYVSQNNDMTKMLLQTGDNTTLYKGENVTYPELDPYYDFYCFENSVGEADEGFEAILQADFTEYEKIPLTYTEETRENYSRLTGSLVPEYYYETDGGNLYFATTYADEMYNVFQVFAYEKDGDKIYYLYNIATKEVVHYIDTQYNE